MERQPRNVTLVTTDRLLGSYLVRVSLSGGSERRLTVHSVLTGERRSCVDFTDLATYLDASTAEAAQRRGERQHVGADGGVDGEASAPDDDDLGPEGHGR